MTKNIRSIFEQNIRLLKGLDVALFYFRKQQYDKALHIVANSVGHMKYAIEAIITDREYFNLVSTDTVLDMLTAILNAQKKRDYILLADLLELQFVSFLCGVQELIISKEEIVFNEEKYLENIQVLRDRGIGFQDITKESINPGLLLESGYRIEFTSTGLMTLAAENNGAQFYFHTNNRITFEAVLLAEHWYQKKLGKYIIYGFGMGYHLEELLSIAKDAEIEIYEGDLNVIKLACAFHDLKDFLDCDRVKIVYDPEFTALKERVSKLSEEEAFFVHYPSYQNIRSTLGRELIENFIPWSKTIESC